MLFAEFYQMSTGYIAGTIPPKFGEPQPIPACGDRSVIILDGRYNMVDNTALARSECIKRGYVGFTIQKGESFSRANEVRKFERV